MTGTARRVQVPPWWPFGVPANTLYALPLHLHQTSWAAIDNAQQHQNPETETVLVTVIGLHGIGLATGITAKTLANTTTNTTGAIGNVAEVKVQTVTVTISLVGGETEARALSGTRRSKSLSTLQPVRA